MALNGPFPDSAPDRSEADVYEQLTARLIAAEAPVAPPAPDGWLSVLRGRLLAVVASGLGLWSAGSTTWSQWQHLRAEGLTPEHAAALAAQAGTLWDSSTALILTITSAVSLVAAGVSWLRGRWRHRAGV